MIYAFYFFAVVLVFLGWQSLRGGFNYLKFFKSELARPPSDYLPFCSIIVPCRGLDEGLRENLAALFRQNFPHYEIVFVVDGEQDAAVEIIEKLIEEMSVSTPPIKTKIVVAGKAENESQKVHNLRQAVLETSDQSEIFVFVDSDARPNDDWLRNLIAPLVDETVGCATGYRWFVAENFSFAAELRAVWNASIASALGANTRANFCWGGSLAVRREVFERIEMREFWRGTLSDDFAVTRRMQDLHLPIHFVPQCLTATVENCTFREFVEFSTRQMKITRIYAPSLWKASFAGSLLFTAVFWSGVLSLFFISGFHFRLTLGFLLVIFALGALKAWLRLKAVKMILKDYERELNRQLIPQLTLWAVTPIIYFYNCGSALLSRKITWRGIEYRLQSPTETEILSTNKLEKQPRK